MTPEEIKADKEARAAYEEERKRAAALDHQKQQLLAQQAELEKEMPMYQESFIYKASKPARFVLRKARGAYRRVKNYGGPKGLAKKIRSKRIERIGMAQHGKKSFPTAEEILRQQQEKFSQDIVVSILVPLFNTPEKFLRDMIESCVNQTYGGWELCLADGSDEKHPEVERIVKEYATKDSRIKYERLQKNYGISGNTNECMKMATGQYIGLFDHDDILHPEALYHYMHAICDEGADYIYCDEVTFLGDDIDDMVTLHFKPDFSPDNLCANNYICHFSVFSKELLDGPDLFRTRYDGSQDHDAILRLTSRAKKIVHVPKMLYYWRAHKGSVASDINAKSYAIDAAKNAVRDYLTGLGREVLAVESTRAFATIFRVVYKVDPGLKVSVLIPNKDHVKDLENCVSSILDKTTHANYEIIIIENNSTQPETFAYYEKLKENKNIRVVTYEGEFNYSKIINFGAAYAEGEYLLLLNNDTKVRTTDWMQEMLMFAQREDVGAVGAKLFMANEEVQHAGVILGLGAHGTAGHSFYGHACHEIGYMGKLCYVQDVSAVTGACMMVRKAYFDEVGGFDETFAVSLNDVDFCLRLREKGLLNIFTPFAELYHFESASRGKDDKGESAERYQKECDLFKERYKEVLAKGDPYYNINLSLKESWELRIF
ncbi:MAG: glycosyltransferase family 2 protein [Lachnospiraceae bacterium]|nr:glycosyltransferase family 2 protein [Lachnospiraceae bacterium]